MRIINILWAEAAAYTDEDAFVCDLALSSIWGDDPEAPIPEDRIDLLRLVWDIHHNGISSLRKRFVLTQPALAAMFGIPVRTIENWDSGIRTPADYVVRMMLQILLSSDNR